MKILYINLPYTGHVIPTVGLVQELIRQGAQVTWLMPYGWEEKVAESGADFLGYRNHPQLSEQIKRAFAAAETVISQYDYVLYEQFFFLGKHLAEKYRKPCARIFTAPAPNEKLMHCYIHAKGPMSIFRSKWICRAFTRDIAKNIPLKTDNWLDEILFNPADRNLVYTLPQFQPCIGDFPMEHYLFLGPSDYERKEPALDFVKKDRPVVYISLGSVMKGSRAFFQTCVDAFRGEHVDVILSTGKQFHPRKLKNIPPNVHIYPSVPQMAVLRMADVFITHCGMNSISEAFLCGTPMVLMPLVSDQPVNAACAEKLGAGRILPYDSVNTKTLQSAAFQVMEDESIRQNMVNIRSWIQTAPGNAGGARWILQHFRESSV